MKSEEIQFFNRYSGKLETEQVYGEAFLKWAYGTCLGRLSLELLVKRALFSRWYGWRMNRGSSRSKVLPFIEKYGLVANDFFDTPDSFQTFNEFFYRKLKPSARPIDSNKSTVVFPADGRHLGFSNVSEMNGIFVKGAVFNLESFIGDRDLAKKYREGIMVLSRLCPVDYHRYHFPVGGSVNEVTIINGALYSVSPLALRKNIQIFTENKRARCTIKSDNFGDVLMFEVGATCVGSMHYTYTPGAVEKGAEKGYFAFGGSSTVTIFEKGAVELADDLLEHSSKRVELYARMGDVMGSK